jgi:hypothetical protein
MEQISVNNLLAGLQPTADLAFGDQALLQRLRAPANETNHEFV